MEEVIKGYERKWKKVEETLKGVEEWIGISRQAIRVGCFMKLL
jgi:hypothetical protein